MTINTISVPVIRAALHAHKSKYHPRIPLYIFSMLFISCFHVDPK